jgi:hypothetical protein
MSEQNSAAINQSPQAALEEFIQHCRIRYHCITGTMPRYVPAVVALADQRDEALQALKMLCDHHYTYAGADADTANDHGLYAKVKTAREALRAVLERGAVL